MPPDNPTVTVNDIRHYGHFVWADVLLAIHPELAFRIRDVRLFETGKLRMPSGADGKELVSLPRLWRPIVAEAIRSAAPRLEPIGN